MNKVAVTIDSATEWDRYGHALSIHLITENQNGVFYTFESEEERQLFYDKMNVSQAQELIGKKLFATFEPFLHTKIITGVEI
jgi:Holliday junction resolvasome RuvABC DNA-binding subunit